MWAGLGATKLECLIVKTVCGLYLARLGCKTNVIAETGGRPCQAGSKHPVVSARSGAGNGLGMETLGTPLLGPNSHWGHGWTGSTSETGWARSQHLAVRVVMGVGWLG